MNRVARSTFDDDEQELDVEIIERPKRTSRKTKPVATAASDPVEAKAPAAKPRYSRKKAPPAPPQLVALPRDRPVWMKKNSHTRKREPLVVFSKKEPLVTGPRKSTTAAKSKNPAPAAADHEVIETSDTERLIKSLMMETRRTGRFTVATTFLGMVGTVGLIIVILPYL